ncbi:MAG: PEGA domain-containing protein [Deltaproteobacteria bacterium]|nr:PEGA domain-containing protein [Deltaproteobacteria bacterium]
MLGLLLPLCAIGAGAPDASPVALIVDAAEDVALASEPRAFVERLKVLRLQPGALEQEKKALELARKEMKRASDAALALESRSAIAHYEAALEQYARAMPVLADLDEVARCLFDLGAAQMDTKAGDKAADAFRRALVLNPSLRADKVRHNPDVVRTFERVRAASERSKRGSLTVSGEPKGADVYLDGKRVAALPASVSSLYAGEHWLSVRAAGRTPFSARFTIEERKVAKLEVFLVEEAARSRTDTVAAILAGDRTIGAADKAELDRFCGEQRAGAAAFMQVRSGNVLARVYDCEMNRISERGKLMNVADAVAFIESALKNEPAPVATIDVPLVAPTPALATAKTGKPAATREIRVHPAVALLPLGIGQFVEERPVAGALLLVSQLLLLATNLSAYFVAQRFAVGNGTYRQPQTVEALKWVTNVSFGLVIADVLAGAIDGIVYRHRVVPVGTP